jgi:hypothetical protein
LAGSHVEDVHNIEVAHLMVNKVEEGSGPSTSFTQKKATAVNAEIFLTLSSYAAWLTPRSQNLHLIHSMKM